MTRIWKAADGMGIGDEIHTRFEPIEGHAGRFKVYKGHRAYPMTTVAADADAVLHDIWPHLAP
jgi:hypothetical protein